jgi:hypothetical protein
MYMLIPICKEQVIGVYCINMYIMITHLYALLAILESGVCNMGGGSVCLDVNTHVSVCMHTHTYVYIKKPKKIIRLIIKAP